MTPLHANHLGKAKEPASTKHAKLIAATRNTQVFSADFMRGYAEGNSPRPGGLVAVG